MLCVPVGVLAETIRRKQAANEVIPNQAVKARHHIHSLLVVFVLISVEGWCPDVSTKVVKS